MALRFSRGRGSLSRPTSELVGGSAATLLLLAALAGPTGCVGPGMAMGDINTAQVELAAAQTAEAPKLAPYEYTLAELYLEQARNRMGSSDYQQAYEYARKASAFARQAVAKAESPAQAPPQTQDAGASDAVVPTGTHP